MSKSFKSDRSTTTDKARLWVAVGALSLTLLGAAAAAPAAAFRTFVTLRQYERDINEIKGMLHELYREKFGRPYGEEPSQTPQRDPYAPRVRQTTHGTPSWTEPRLPGFGQQRYFLAI